MIMEAGGDSAAAAPHRATPAASGGTDAPPGPLQSPHSPEEEEEDVQERRPKAGERAGWEDAIALMARDAAVLPGPSADSSLRSCTSTASMKVKNVKKLALSKNHFPRLAECAHFHYENVDFGSVQLNLTEDQNDPVHSSLNSKELVYLIQITCQGKKWTVRRSYEDFRVLDKHLHLCIYDRRFSQLAELPRLESFRDPAETLSQMLTAYLSRLSSIADNKINCGPTLTWMEIDNKGNHLLVHDESFINVPAVAAAHVTKRYTAQAADELSFEVGDIVSVIDMPPKEDSGWWRGKHGFQVGFFPSECVEIISEKVTPNVTNTSAKPVSGKHGKLITFLRTYVKSRPTKQKLKQRGILRERVFGCDLGEHLLNSGSDVPQVIKSCTEFIEKHGIVDGIYRLSGISSNIQKLRHEFDSEHIPELTKDTYVQDIHCVGSLCKLYFRELPNPLLTYQLYDKFSDAVSAATDDERLVKIHDVIQQLPPPHYRTLEFLMRHLARMAAFSYVTNMHSKNLAIVWAPNLLRSRQIESACFGGTSAFMEVRIQSVVVEFILNHVDVLFSSRLSTLIRESTGHNTLARPKSLLVCSPSTKLLSLEEAQARTQAQLASPVSPGSKYIEVGEGPAALQGKFHTVIELPLDRKKAQPKVKKSPVASWRSFFSMAKSTTSKRKMRQHVSVPSGIKTMALPGGRGDNATLRSAKSEESLSSNLEGASVQVYQSRRPRSTSDAISTSFHEDLLKPRVHRESRKAQAGSITCVPALISSPQSTDGHFGTDGGPDRDPALSRDGDGRKPSTNEKCRGSSIELGGPTGASRENASERHLTSDKLMTGTKEPDSSETPPAGCTQDPEVDPETKGQPGRDDDQHRRPSSLLSLDAESPDKSSDDQASTLKQTESGAVTFDCTPGLVRSVSLITSQPAVKSAARMLALALAESAQQASSQRKRGSSEPPTPVSPLHLQDPLSALLWPSPLPSQPPGSTTSEEIREASGKPAGTASAGTHADLGGSPQSTCACHGSESGLSVTGSPESALPAHPPVRENVRHVGVGTDNGSPGGTSEVENRSALAALLSKQAANESNFRVILAEASVPASVHDVPQAPASPPAYHPCGHEENTGRSSGYIFLSQACHYQPDYVHHQPPILTRDLYGTLAPRTIHQSIKHKGPRRHDYLAGCSYRHGGPRYPPMDGASVYPTIRRVRSMHAPPDDSFFFSPQSSNPHATFQRPLPSRFRQVRPYFADGRVQYRFKPCSGARHDPDHYPTSGPGYNRPYSLHRMPGHPGRVESHHNPSGNLPFGTEGGSANRNVSPVLRMKADRLSDRTVRQRTVGKPHDPTLPPRPQKAGQRWKEPTHIRNKSDSFRDLLISTEGADGKYRVTMVTHHSPEHPPPEPERPGYAPAGPAPTLKQSRSMQNYTQAPPPHLTLHKEYSCPDFKHTEYPKEDHQRARVRDVDPQRSERSHSMKNHQQPRPVKMTLDHEHRLSYPAQIRQRTRSMFAPSRTMYTDSHGAVQPKGPTVYPNYGCMAPHRSRLYTTDIGTGSFLRSKLRAKTEVYAE